MWVLKYNMYTHSTDIKLAANSTIGLQFPQISRVEGTLFKPNIWEVELDRLWLNYTTHLETWHQVSMRTLEQKNVRAIWSWFQLHEVAGICELSRHPFLITHFCQTRTSLMAELELQKVSKIMFGSFLFSWEGTDVYCSGLICFDIACSRNKPSHIA